MKRLILISLSLALCVYGWSNIRDYAWVPAGVPKWNPFAIRESGIGRTAARALTEQANASYHHGLLERKPPTSTNPLSHWLDASNASLGFQGRLKYRPIDKYPLRPFEVKQALEQVEKNLRLAFELDPANYTAYDVYLFFLTNKITQTEFASMAGAQLKDEDEEEHADPGGDAQKRNLPDPNIAIEQHTASQVKATGSPVKKEPAQQAGDFKNWAEQERLRRHARAIQITDEAIRKFRPNTMDPERFLTAAVMWYNRFMLLAPDPDQRRASAEARRKFEEVGPPTLIKMEYYIEAAKACQYALEQKGLWQKIPERRAEYMRVLQLLQKCAFALSVALENNRTQMTKDRPATGILGALGRN